MSAKEIADAADMIVSGYAYKIRDAYIEVVDLSNVDRVSTIQDGVIAESLMSDEEDEKVLKFYLRNKELLEESVNA